MNKEFKKKQIQEILKIKNPFLMIDRVKIISENKIAIGIKKLKKKDWYFKSHFYNNNPVFPGTLQTECMLQSTIVALYRDKEKIKKFFIIKTETSFTSKIIKPCNLNIHVKILKNKNGIVLSKASILLNSKKVSDGKFTFIDPQKFRIKR